MTILAKGSGPLLVLSAGISCASAVGYYLTGNILVLIVLALGIASLLFFLEFYRDPERTIANGIVSPADGLIRAIEDRGEITYVSIFMNVHNVHVNRAPLAGKVSKVEYRPGGHIPAFKKESDRNERNDLYLETDIGQIKVVQIAGTLARRVVSYVSGGEVLMTGERFGMIRLGSRVDIYMPSNKVSVVVTLGEKVLAGSTKIAEVRS